MARMLLLARAAAAAAQLPQGCGGSALAVLGSGLAQQAHQAVEHGRSHPPRLAPAAWAGGGHRHRCYSGVAGEAAPPHAGHAGPAGSSSAGSSGGAAQGHGLHGAMQAGPSPGEGHPQPSPSSGASEAGLLHDVDVVACSGLEDAATFFGPVQLGVQLWEAVHASTGLPWLVAIPVGTLAVRGLLLPLSLKAKAASANLLLLDHAVSQARELTSDMPAADARSLGRTQLVRRIFRQLRSGGPPVPGFKWYMADAAVQVAVLVSLTLALRQMCDALWPGMASEGGLLFKDLTSPPVILQTLSTPFGTAGAILPLAIFFVYLSVLELSAGGRTVGINAAMRVLAVPLYFSSMTQPHAVLLYWLTHGAALWGFQLAAARPALAARLKLPPVLLPPSAAPAGAGASAPGGLALVQVATDTESLLALASSYQADGNRVAAAACYSRALRLQPDCEAAKAGLAQVSSSVESQQQQ